MREIRLKAHDLPYWRRLPRARQTLGFDALFVTLKERVLPKYSQWKRIDCIAPGGCVCGESWIRNLWWLERDRLARNGEILPSYLVFVVTNEKYLQYVGYDCRIRIWPEWFGIAFNAVQPGDKVIIEL